MRILILVYLLFGLFTAEGLGRDFNILDFGAVPDGKTLNTRSIQAAIDAAFEQGGGRVVVPEGKFLTGSIIIRSGITLYLHRDAVILGSTDPSLYSKTVRWKALILASDASDIAITGKGEIDGQGRELALHIDSLFYAGQIDSMHYNFVEMRPKFYLRPQLIEFVNCRNIEIRNITLRDAACWVQTYDLCENIIIDSVTVESDAYWNNDGLDISDCRNVSVTNCNINSADDGICLKSHSENHSCDSIYIANCTVRSSASAVKFGTRSHGGFTNVRIENIRVYDTFRSAIAIECVDGGILENVLVENINAVNTGNAIFIRLGRRNEAGEVGKLRNVVIRDIKVEVAFGRPDGAYDIRGPDLPFFHNTMPSSITGIPGHPVENVLLENVAISYPGRGNNGLANMPLSRLGDVPENESGYPEFSMFGELPAWGFYVRHADNLILRNVSIRSREPDYRPPVIFDDVENVVVEDMLVDGEDKNVHIVMRNAGKVKIDKGIPVLKIQ